MRKIFWSLLFLFGYLYLSTSGKERVFVEKAKALYQWVSAWLESAELDFHLEKEGRKRSGEKW